MGENEEEAVVLPLFAAGTDDEAPLLMKAKPDWCRHARTEVDGEARRVYCRDCKREVPAFDVLQRLAKSHDRFVSSRDTAQREARVLRGELENLKREERNVKARIRNAKKKATELGE